MTLIRFLNIFIFQMASDLMNPVQCNICEKAVAKFNCNTCGDVLCATCKAYHLKSRATGDHKIVPYAEKLNPKYIAQLFCSIHTNHAPKFWCETCGVPICDACATKEHGGHKCSNIIAVLTEKRDAMVDEMKMIRDNTMGEWKEVLKQAQATTDGYLTNISKIEKQLVTRAKEMHREVETILLSSQQTLKEMKESGLGKLKDQEKYIEDRLQQLQDDVQRYEDQLRDADPHVLLQFEQGTGERKDETKPPALETSPVTVFTKGQHDTKAMKNMFGQLSTQAIHQKGREIPKKSLANLSTPDPAATAAPPQTKVRSSPSSATQRSLIPTPSVQSQFSVKNPAPFIACVDQGQAWVYTCYKTLQLVDRQGSVSDTINTDFDINGMTVTADGELLMSDFSNNCIRSVSRKKEITTQFSTSWRPHGLCCLHNDIVVTFRNDSKVVVYSRDGDIRQKMEHIKFRYPMGVAVNKVNQDIYICDHISGGWNSACKVVTVRADGQLRYEYPGQGGQEFAPVDVCTDQMGHVLITDYSNHRVHILDQEGQFIQYILTSQQGLYKPTTIGVDMEGYIWVGQYNKWVKVVRYLQ